MPVKTVQVDPRVQRTIKCYFIKQDQEKERITQEKIIDIIFLNIDYFEKLFKTGFSRHGPSLTPTQSNFY